MRDYEAPKVTEIGRVEDLTEALTIAATVAETS